MGKTAAELMAELANSQEYQTKKNARDEHFSRLEKMYGEDEKQLVEELKQSGFQVRSVWDLVNSKNDYLGAEPILLKHLKSKHHPRILAGIARSLAVPEFSCNDELWEFLVKLYGETSSDTDIAVSEQRGAQEAIAIALETLATAPRLDSLKKLVVKVPNGDGVHWLQHRMTELSSKLPRK